MSTRNSTIGKIGLALVASSSVVACASAPTAQETAMLDALETNQILPASRMERDDAGRQDLLSQAAFWGKEYDKNPSDYEAALRLAQVLRMIGNSGRASEIAAQALNQKPNDVEMTLVFAQSSLDIGKPQDAVTPLARIENDAGSDWRICSIIGVTLDQLGQHEDARSYYLKALDITPGNPKVLSNMGLSYALAGDTKRAEETLRVAVDAPNADARIRQNLALVLGVQGRFEEAEVAIGEDAPAALVESATTYYRTLLNPARTYEKLRTSEN